RVRVAHADVHAGDTEACHRADPRQGLRQVWPQRVVLPRTPGAAHRRLPGTRLALAAAGALAVGEAVVDIQPCGDHQAGDLAADSRQDVPGQARAVLQAAAVGARPGFGRQQFAQQIAVALLDVDELEAAAVRQPGGGNVLVHQAAQVVV